MLRKSLILLALTIICSLTSAVAVAEPGWTGRVIKRGEERAVMENTPILERPYRPLHVYGNTVRRRHYRGTAVPQVQDMVRGSAAVVTRR